MSTSNEFNFTLKNDYAFKRLLGVEENKAILQDFLECVLDLCGHCDGQNYNRQNNDVFFELRKSKSLAYF